MSFKVIVVGGGPVGLTVAHTLSKAGIDFVVLEREPVIAPDRGASLILYPNTMRVLSQVGLLDRLFDIGAEAGDIRIVDADGRLHYTSDATGLCKPFLGCSAYTLGRADFIQAIYDGLSESDRARVLLNKRVVDITSDDSGARVCCADGSKYEGSIVIGTDGVHSIVRQRMRALALQASPNIKIDEDNPFPSEYRALWCSIPLQGVKNGGPPGSLWATHAKGLSANYIIGCRRAWFFIYERLPATTRERVRYTEADVLAFAEKYGDLAVSDNLKIKDVFPQRSTAGMANLEEGMLKRWTWGRIVLVGDSAHKYTPNLALGFNNGAQDAVALTNELYHVLNDPPQGQHHNRETEDDQKENGISMEVLTAAFERYQKARIRRCNDDSDSSFAYVRTNTWPNICYWFLDWWVQPLIPRWLEVRIIRNTLIDPCSKGYVLDFLDGEEPFSAGKVAWEHPIPNPALRALKGKKSVVRTSVPFWRILGVCCVGLAATVSVGYRDSV